MRSRFDQFAKQMVRTALESFGVVEIDVDVATGEPATQTADDQEFLMATEDVIETWRREVIQEGFKQGLAHSLVAAYDARFGAMPEDLRAEVEGTSDGPTLVAWLRLAATRGADELATAISPARTG